MSTALDSEIEEITTIIEAIETGDIVTALRVARSRLYYLQEIKPVWDSFDEQQDIDLRMGVEDDAET